MSSVAAGDCFQWPACRVWWVSLYPCAIRFGMSPWRKHTVISGPMIQEDV